MNKRRLMLLLVLIITVLNVGMSSAISVNKIISLNAYGPVPSTPLTVTVLCNGGSCTRTSAPDWTNANRFYGSSGTNCRVTTDGGTTWGNCGANPWLTTVYDWYAVASDGSVLAAGNDSGGIVFRVARSTDNANTWTQVFTNSAVTSDTGHTHIKCAESTSTCIIIYTDTANNAITLLSTDNGATWTQPASPGIVVYNSYGPAFANDGSVAISAPTSSNGFSNYRVITFDGSSTFTRGAIWPTTGSGVCYAPLIYESVGKAICTTAAGANTYELVDDAGNVEKTFTLPNAYTTATINTLLAASIQPSGIWIVGLNQSGSTSVWASVDDGATFHTLTTITGVLVAPNDMFVRSGCAYFSYTISGGATSVFGKVC